jgi:hypothetical protein
MNRQVVRRHTRGTPKPQSSFTALTTPQACQWCAGFAVMRWHPAERPWHAVACSREVCNICYTLPQKGDRYAQKNRRDSALYGYAPGL